MDQWKVMLMGTNTWHEFNSVDHFHEILEQRKKTVMQEQHRKWCRMWQKVTFNI
jgi:hypothetical protein